MGQISDVVMLILLLICIFILSISGIILNNKDKRKGIINFAEIKKDCKYLNGDDSCSNKENNYIDCKAYYCPILKSMLKSSKRC